MIIAQWADYFDILQDKYGSPYFTDTEKSLLFNRASVQFVAEFFPVIPGEINVELDRDTIATLAPLIYELPAITMSASGIITKAAIQAALVALVAGAVLWREVGGIKATLGTEITAVNYTRHNDWAQFLNNSFKTPTDSNPKVYETALDYRFLPINTITNMTFTVLKYPKTVLVDSVTPANNINSDLPDFTHDKILALALELAGISSRDASLIELKATRTLEI